MRFGSIFAVAICLYSIRSVSAEESTTAYFYLEDEPIYTTNSKEAPGFLLEVMTLMTDNLGVNQSVEFTPWRRAQKSVQSIPDTWIYPLARTTERENLYHWVMPLLKVPVVFATKVGEPKIDTIQQAAEMSRVLVISGSAQEQYLKNLGMKNIASVPSTRLANILHLNPNITAFVAVPELTRAWKLAGFTEDLQFGNRVDQLVLWFAGNKEQRSISDEQWLAAFKDVKDNGKFDQIMETYFGVALSQ